MQGFEPMDWIHQQSNRLWFAMNDAIRSNLKVNKYKKNKRSIEAISSNTNQLETQCNMKLTWFHWTWTQRHRTNLIPVTRTRRWRRCRSLNWILFQMKVKFGWRLRPSLGSLSSQRRWFQLLFQLACNRSFGNFFNFAFAYNKLSYNWGTPLKHELMIME